MSQNSKSEFKACDIKLWILNGIAREVYRRTCLCTFLTQSTSRNIFNSTMC